MIDIDDIQRERQIIKLLGFNLSKPDKNKNYQIFDNNKEQVGYIKYNKNSNKAENKDINNYYLHIDNEDFLVKSGVEQPDELSTPLTFYIKFKKFGTYVYLHMGPDFTNIRMHYFHSIPNNKILRFKLDKNGFDFQYNEPGDFYIDERIRVDLKELLYIYKISFDDIYDVTHNYPSYSGELSCQANNQNSELIIKNFWDCWRGKTSNNGKNNYISIVEGNLKDAIVKHHMGIDAVNRLRYLINIPFKEDIIEFIIKNAEFELPKYLDLFIPETNDLLVNKTLIKSSNY